MATVKPQMGYVAVIIAHPTDSDNHAIKDIKEEVRQIMDHVEEYTTVHECEEFIRSTRYEYIFIIVTSSFVNDIFINNLHQIRHVQSIFLFDPYGKINSSNICRLRKSSYKVSKIIFFHDMTENNDIMHNARCKSHLLHQMILSDTSRNVHMNGPINLMLFFRLWLAAHLIQ
jgi:hypothetical protein